MTSNIADARRSWKDSFLPFAPGRSASTVVLLRTNGAFRNPRIGEGNDASIISPFDEIEQKWSTVDEHKTIEIRQGIRSCC